MTPINFNENPYKTQILPISVFKEDLEEGFYSLSDNSIECWICDGYNYDENLKITEENIKDIETGHVLIRLK